MSNSDMSKIELSKLDRTAKSADMINANSLKSLNDLASFVGKTAMPRKHRSDFWNAYKSAISTQDAKPKSKSVSELLAVVMTISARTRRIVAPKTNVELDVFLPNGKRAVQLIMGTAS